MFKLSWLWESSICASPTGGTLSIGSCTRISYPHRRLMNFNYRILNGFQTENHIFFWWSFLQFLCDWLSYNGLISFPELARMPPWFLNLLKCLSSTLFHIQLRGITFWAVRKYWKEYIEKKWRIHVHSKKKGIETSDIIRMIEYPKTLWYQMIKSKDCNWGEIRGKEKKKKRLGNHPNPESKK